MQTIMEREIKLRFDTAEQARDAVVASGASPLRGRRLQEDYLLDTHEETLRRRRCALRVRVEAGKSRVTFKGPAQPSPLHVREELETMVGDGDTLLRIFAELGWTVWFRYQKYREEFAREDVIVAIDETPVGTFVELEGGEQGIAGMTEALGRTPGDYVVDNYRSLFLQYCAEHGLTDGDMVFDES